eukprot:TRINITY_DN39520_c0_g1_i1.p1 TRINITY_DN39520_c0_g1~~TRINITY_DN39520_c0_g1_i1.p1  ORF type:complete len:178 (-),score=34.73 TRINITY_DN39520_c0_g1_i1:66-599(-)
MASIACQPTVSSVDDFESRFLQKDTNFGRDASASTAAPDDSDDNEAFECSWSLLSEPDWRKDKMTIAGTSKNTGLRLSPLRARRVKFEAETFLSVPQQLCGKPDLSAFDSALPDPEAERHRKSRVPKLPKLLARRAQFQKRVSLCIQKQPFQMPRTDIFDTELPDPEAKHHLRQFSA